MDLINNFNLQPFTTFGVPAVAKQFGVIRQQRDWENILGKGLAPSLILGGGSNILFVNKQQDFVVKNELFGKRILTENEDEVIIEVGSGENWHEFVHWSLLKGFGGLENLSLIPGTVGAAPIQNIGAYGIEQKNRFHSLKYIDLQSGKVHELGLKACDFGYRDSIFKNELKGKVAILSVTYRLQKRHFDLNIQYGHLEQSLHETGILSPTPLDIHRAIINIRQQKLPDPKKLGNAGSFFKNPIISHDEFENLKEKYPSIPHYQQSEGVKIPAAWLIQSCGWKGYRKDDVGIYPKHALILVNFGKGSGQEIKTLAMEIIDSVQEKFSIKLIPEVTFC